MLSQLFLVAQHVKYNIQYQKNNAHTETKVPENKYVDEKRDDVYMNLRLIEGIYKQHENAKERSSIMLFLGIGSLLFGAIFFYFAADVANRERDDRKKAVKSEVSNIVRIEYRERYADSQGINFDSLQNFIKDPNTSDSSRSRAIVFRDDLYKHIDEIYGEAIYKATQDALKNSEETSSYFDNWYIFFTTVTLRIIISILTFYLAQLFFKLHKYYLQISDFYINRCDAIKAHKAKDFDINFQELIKIFEHKIDVGIGPKSPIDSALKIFKTFKDTK